MSRVPVIPDSKLFELMKFTDEEDSNDSNLFLIEKSAIVGLNKDGNVEIKFGKSFKLGVQLVHEVDEINEYRPISLRRNAREVEVLRSELYTSNRTKRILVHL